MKKYYMNKDTGELFTHEEALKEFFEEYDGNDQTNAVEFSEMYEERELED